MRTTHCPQPNMSGRTEPSVPHIGSVSSAFSPRPRGCAAFLNAHRVSYALPTTRALFGAVVYRSLNPIRGGRVPLDPLVSANDFGLAILLACLTAAAIFSGFVVRG
jgi:hypothetical protein